MADLDGQERKALDCRSVVILAEPIFAPGQVLWHAMAFVAGENHNDITGTNRAVVLDDCLSSIAERGVEFSFDPVLTKTATGTVKGTNGGREPERRLVGSWIPEEEQ